MQIDAGALKAALAKAAQAAGSDDDLDSDDEGPSAPWRGADDMYDPGADEEEAEALNADDEQALQVGAGY